MAPDIAVLAWSCFGLVAYAMLRKPRPAVAPPPSAPATPPGPALIEVEFETHVYRNGDSVGTGERSRRRSVKFKGPADSPVLARLLAAAKCPPLAANPRNPNPSVN